MKVIAEYPVTKTIEIEIPNELAEKYHKAIEEENQDEQDDLYDVICDYVDDTIREKEGIYFLDWVDWEEVD